LLLAIHSVFVVFVLAVFGILFPLGGGRHTVFPGCAGRLFDTHSLDTGIATTIKIPPTPLAER